ncbi:AAA family ATPase [Candidatus Uhrbacteria bacterium]|nr:AAA family ATPase [Candidatus Uhrbacteria bacterium]
MYLSRLELQGFKTFAQRTVLEFMSAEAGKRGVTGIVGPNGSGKSNVADALRWVMGEQSMKLLRSKKSEDVIFSGSAKKSRAGFAEVGMTIVNDNNSEIDLPEIVITRRLYRDGQSEYEINKQAARMSDVVMLLAQCGIGQRTYSVIGQGMVDAVLTASPSERKEFFDEASGLRPFQLKRTSAMNKLDGARDNLRQAEILMREIEPRLTSLERQVKRLKQREALEQELKQLERQYFGSGWAELKAQLAAATANADKLKTEFSVHSSEVDKLESELGQMEKATPVSSELREMRTAIDALKEERSKLREKQIRLESKREVRQVEQRKPWAPLPLSKIIERIETLSKTQDELLAELEAKAPDWDKVKKLAQSVKQENEKLLTQLQQPAPEPTKEEKADPELEKEFAVLAKETSDITSKISDLEGKLQALNKKEDESRAHLFELQRRLTSKRHEAQQAEQRVSSAAVEMARLETRRDGFLTELRQQAADLEKDLENIAGTVGRGEVASPQGGDTPPLQGEHLRSRIQKLRSQLEWIGGIDPETVKEYETTSARFEQLSTQSADLRQAITSLEMVISELDKTIKEKGDVAFRELNREFGIFFKKLFGGGDAELIKIEKEDVPRTASEVPGLEGEGEQVVGDEDEENVQPAGIEIQATPPGKRLKAIALLSGGERALTSIALICAIMAINPSPFVVLDEVDAALDEANTRKFAEIVDSLSDWTQFIVVTHNRATMDKANVLYGVTMGDDGVSQLLSVKLGQSEGSAIKT